MRRIPYFMASKLLEVQGVYVETLDGYFTRVKADQLETLKLRGEPLYTNLHENRDKDIIPSMIIHESCRKT